ncbi:unnamed protein product [Gulo gulo]|uniref:Uncharacterized protein n=1 Tax=Gulo gulo TaxID=48420 RepID=A0A9X9PT47_GULGU|nr:unnamed protein product [Gulo gulo]
MSAQTGTV